MASVMGCLGSNCSFQTRSFSRNLSSSGADCCRRSSRRSSTEASFANESHRSRTQPAGCAPRGAAPRSARRLPAKARSDRQLHFQEPDGRLRGNIGAGLAEPLPPGVKAGRAHAACAAKCRHTQIASLLLADHLLPLRPTLLHRRIHKTRLTARTKLHKRGFA